MCPYVLILDGWDELPLSGNHGYLERLRSLLTNLKEVFFRRQGAVMGILAGRPSHFLSQSGTLSPETRIVTLQPWGGGELGQFIERVRDAHRKSDENQTQLSIEPLPGWHLPNEKVLNALLERFRRARRGGTLDILGSPLIAHLCLRMLGENGYENHGSELGELLQDETTLYRGLVDLVIAKAGKPFETPYDPGPSAMITGNDLRALLHRTAEAMTVLGTENITRDDLLLRLGIDEHSLSCRLEQLEGEELLSRLMISFFFKGGYGGLGCEFSHKSFREYLFAECIIEVLKDYGLRVTAPPPARSIGHFWKDFEADDPRHALARRLSDLLGPQWITPDTSGHLQRLLEWELTRSTADTTHSFLRTCSVEQWAVVRDALADLWDWWGEGVHMRPQPRRRRNSRDFDWLPPLAYEVACDLGPHPVRLVTIDSHLGDGLYRLNALLHAGLEQPSDSPARRYQRRTDTGLRFAPSGERREYFVYYCHRINAAGYRPSGQFPGAVFSRGVDLRKPAELSTTDIQGVNLRNVSLAGVDLLGADLQHADLEDADLRRSDLSGANLRHANLRNANLSGANLVGADLEGADLHGAVLDTTVLCDVDLTELLRVTPDFRGRPLVDNRSIIKSINNPRPALKRFLIASGMDELYAEYAIESARAVVAKGGLMQSTYVSYGEPDEAFARKLNQRLLDHMVATFFFPLDAEPGARLHREMRKGIQEGDRVIVICSRNSLDRKGFQNELAQTLEREAREGGAAILIPIRLDDYILDWKPEREYLREELLSRVAADFSNHDDDEKFEEALSRLLKVLRRKG